MRFFGKLSIAAAVLMASTSLSLAADIIPEPDPIPEVVPVAQASGWYLRGDVGYSSIDAGDVNYEQFRPSYCGGGCGDYTYIPEAFGWNEFSKADLDDTWNFQGGVGYQVNDYFRVDFTAGYFDDADFDGVSSSKSKFDCDGLGPDNDVCSSKDTTKLKMRTLMANAYFDLGNFSGITPYVGGGIGGAYVKWDELDNDIDCKMGGAGDCLTPTIPGYSYKKIYDSKHDGNNDWRFAWAVHAGASIDLTCNTKLDAGYTYTRVEGGDMFDWGSKATLGGTQGYTDDLDVHTGRVGLRYQLGGCQQAYVPQEVPVYK